MNSFFFLGGFSDFEKTARKNRACTPSSRQPLLSVWINNDPDNFFVIFRCLLKLKYIIQTCRYPFTKYCCQWKTSSPILICYFCLIDPIHLTRICVYRKIFEEISDNIFEKYELPLWWKDSLVKKSSIILLCSF